ncbi:MAG: Gfo/Idh/MocA family oxidoreductase [Myxococcota bacterium]|nr:Gfo/Idh/MocA family oxidoreductase [Myxococcota bacterium]
MKQVVQSPRSGKLELVEVPAPSPGPGQVLVRTHFSVMSPGTEKMAMEFARKSLLGKAQSRPDLVKQVTRKLRQEGPAQTYRAVMGRLDAPQPLGYSSAGVVEEVGPGVRGFAPGDRVACAGAGYANHAELNVVPENLVALVPDPVGLDKAAYATVGAIAMQGIRLAKPQLGDVAVVVGLGLIGQLAVQLLHANGCRVLGIDTDEARAKQALDQGAEWVAAPDSVPESWKDTATEGHGADLAIVAASANSSAPIALAAELCRQKGRLSIVGAMPMDLERRAFFDKELELVVSMSYGPGRYDHRYEEQGYDYPRPFVRWTENRNLQSFLSLVASGAIDPGALDTDLVAFSDATESYEALASGARSALSILFHYSPDEASAGRRLDLADGAVARAKKDVVGVAFIGAGNYAKGVLLPALAKCKNAQPVSLVTATGPSARRSAERFGFATCATDSSEALGDDAVDLVFVTTRHDSHAELAEAALRAGKAVWLEKPVGLNCDEVARVVSAARESNGFLTVGYNRRFSTHTKAIVDAFASRGTPLAMHYTIAAGAPPAGTWITDPEVGGGRVIGEMCHFVDLCTHVVGSPPVRVHAQALGRDPERDDSVIASLTFADGSVATLAYLASASSELPKERFEVSCEGRTLACDNFRVTTGHGVSGLKTLNQDKGQEAAVAEVVAALRAGAPSPISLDDIEAVSLATFAILESIETGRVIEVAG